MTPAKLANLAKPEKVAKWKTNETKETDQAGGLRGLLVSDLHSGSVVSPAVPKARTDYSGGTVGLNPFQRSFLLPRWKEMCSAGPYDFIVVNGDLVDGLNRKSRGTGLWTYLLDLQAENAARLLGMIETQPDAPIFILGGTEYHVDSNPGMDQVVAEKLGVLGKNAHYKGLEHLLTYGSQKFHFSHWASNAMYDGTALSKEVLLSQKHEIDLTGMVRGHRHHYGMYTNGFRFSAMLPAWKGRDEFVQGRGMLFATVQIGWVDFNITGDSWALQPHLWNLRDFIPKTTLGGRSETFQ